MGGKKDARKSQTRSDGGGVRAVRSVYESVRKLFHTPWCQRIRRGGGVGGVGGGSPARQISPIRAAAGPVPDPTVPPPDPSVRQRDPGRLYSAHSIMGALQSVIPGRLSAAARWAAGPSHRAL